MAYRDLQAFIAALEKRGELMRISAPVSPILEITEIAEKIGTYETSILPYEDCCTVFTPRHPRLRPMPGEVEAAEQTLDIDAMVKAAVDGIERVQVNL